MEKSEHHYLRPLFTKLSGLDEEPNIFPMPDDSRRGLIGYTDDLSLSFLYAAYIQGVFPWFVEENDEPVLWWSPDPRFVLIPEELHEPERLSRFIKHSPYTYTFDKAFKEVILNCSKVERADQKGSWIGNKIIDAYTQMHLDGNAHSVEVWHNEKLVGGFYGVLIGRIFFGESMFTIEPNSAKSAFILFVKAFRKAGGKLIDSQVYTDNISRFGGKNISRLAFLHLEDENLFEQLTSDLKETFYQTVATFSSSS